MSFYYFREPQNSPVQGALCRQYRDIGKKRNTGDACACMAFPAARNPPCGSACPVMADSDLPRRAERLLAVSGPGNGIFTPADRVYPEAFQTR
jgi:hypothetical protein